MLDYVGSPVAATADLVYHDYLSAAKDQDLTQAEVDALITAGMSPYANRTYVDAQDMLLAKQSYIDAQDNTRVRLLHKDIANGVPSLDVTGKIDPSFIYTATSDQKWNQGIWSPSAYNAAAVNASTTEVTLYTCPVTPPAPGYPYRLMVTGLVDARSNLSAEHPVVRVRVGSPTGEIIAMGRGQNEAMETFQFGDDFNRTANDLGSDWNETYYENGEGTYSPNGSEAIWHEVGAQNCTLRARRVNTFDRYHGTNYQGIIARIGTQKGEAPIGGNDQYLRIYGRMNDAETQYVYAQISEDQARLIYANNGSEAQIGNAFPATQDTNTPYIFYAGLPGAPRTFWLYKNTSLIFQIEDTGAVTALGTNNRGWGFGVRAAYRLGVFQSNPPNLDYVKAFEPLLGYTSVMVAPRRLDQMTALNGATTLYVTLARSATAATVTATASYPKLNVTAYAA